MIDQRMTAAERLREPDTDCTCYHPRVMHERLFSSAAREGRCRVDGCDCDGYRANELFEPDCSGAWL